MDLPHVVQRARALTRPTWWRRRLGKASCLAAVGLVGLGVVLGIEFGATHDAANAAKPHQLSTLWAVVDAGGTLVRGKGALTAVHDGPGVYTVFFNRDVSNCAYTATTAGGNAGYTGVDDAGVRDMTVETAAGASLADLPFHVIVAC